MKVVYHGFDGLELAIERSLSHDLAEQFEGAKIEAQKRGADVPFNVSGIWLHVKETGSRGGYSYICQEHESGTWFFKKPNKRDKWGIRFSAASSALAVHGLEGIRLRIKKVCEALGIQLNAEAYSLSRVDFAVDFLAPDFELFAENFVSHSQTGRKTIGDLTDYEVNGRSCRVSSVTVGKMPGRQAIIYDKRAEVIVHRKVEWPMIWARALGEEEGSSIDLSDKTKSQIWRVEIRVAKGHLKDVWHVKGWSSFYEQLPKIFIQMVGDIRYCEPTTDKNRARWPLHPIWRAVGKTVEQSLFAEVPRLCAEQYRGVLTQHKRDELLMQALSLLTSAGGIDGILAYQLPTYAQVELKRLSKELERSKRPVVKRLAEARERFRYLI